MFFRCGRGVFGWSFLFGFAYGLGVWGEVLFSVCFHFAAIFVFMLVSSLVFKSISFRGFYRGPLPDVDYGSVSCSLLLVSFSLPGWMLMLVNKLDLMMTPKGRNML